MTDSDESLASFCSARLWDSDAPPARVISRIQETREIVDNALQEIDAAELANKSARFWKPKWQSTWNFLISSEKMFRHIHKMLEKSNPEKEKFSVLIVTHNDDYILIQETILVRTGNWDVQKVETGEAAIESHLDGKSFDLIILHDDLLGLDGPRMAEWFRDHDVKTLIVGFTALDRGSPEREFFIKTGVNFCLKKPILSHREAMKTFAMELEIEVYEYLRGEVNKLGSIVSDMERVLGIPHGGCISRRSRRRKKKKGVWLQRLRNDIGH